MEELELIKEGISKLVEKEGYSIFSFKYKRKNKDHILEVIIDKDDSISMDDIVNVSNLISSYLDEHDFTDDNYTLDVSSLGAEKPLDINKLSKYLNKYIYVHTINPVENYNSYEGDLLEDKEDEIVIEIRIKTRKKKIIIKKENIDAIRLAIKF